MMEQAPIDADPYHVVGSYEHAMGRMLVLKRGDTFLVMNRAGEIRQRGFGEEGFFFHGTRHASRYRLRIDGQRLLLLSSSVASDNLQLMIDLTNPDAYDQRGRLLVPYGTLHFARSIFVEDGHFFERMLVTSYADATVEVSLALEFGADFSDIFEVRGTARAKHGTRAPGQGTDSSASIRYRGLDGLQRLSTFQFHPQPTDIDAKRALFAIRLENHQTTALDVHILAEQGEDCDASLRAASYGSLVNLATQELEDQKRSECRIETSNEMFNEWLNRSRADLRMLLTPNQHGNYPYAGVPWFSTPFGRDGIWTALQTLWLDPSIARGVLGFLSMNQATETDSDSDAEPGKIFHEMRDGEMANLGEVPFKRYYGSVDSTPLYLCLAARYHQVTADRELLERIWPNLVLATRWLTEYGDLDGDGFIEYRTRSSNGLVQQGWKDSHDSVFHQDGSAAQGPIALCEVQGYAYAALRGMAQLASDLGHSSLADQWRGEAELLKARFDAAFWCDELSTFALALDGDKRQCRVKTSNAAHCLYTGIARPERVQPLAQQLLSSGLFSGWGIRTLSSDEKCYNPMSYHNGSVWPHDNAVAAEGLAENGCVEASVKLLTAIFDVSLFMDLSRLPELFCGFSRQPGLAPTRYPVACSPQAWASGAAFALLRSVLGLQVYGAEGRVVFKQPLLPPFLQEIRLLRLPVGNGQVDLKIVRYADDVGLTILRTSGDIEVVVIK